MAKIDTTTIEGYDTMTAEQKLAALEGFEYEDHSGEVDTLRASLSKANGEAADWKRKHHELLSEDERKATERAEHEAKLQADLDEANKTIAVSKYTNQFLAAGYSAELAADTALAMADGDTAKVFANQKTFLEQHDKDLKAGMLKGTPHPQGGSADVSLDDLQKKVEEAMAAGDVAQASKYTRMIAERNSAKK